ncbi:helix-turn-helix domain-containing protein [Tardisphaera miroshnichenkoae]
MKLYPTDCHKVLLEKHFGACTFVYNHFLEERDKYYISHKDTEKSSLDYLDTQNMLIDLKRRFPWLYEINSQSLQMSLRFLDNAFKGFLPSQCRSPRVQEKRK